MLDDKLAKRKLGEQHQRSCWLSATEREGSASPGLAVGTAVFPLLLLWKPENLFLVCSSLNAESYGTVKMNLSKNADVAPARRE